MNFSTYNDLAVQMAADLVNTRNPVDDTDTLTTVAELTAFLDAYERDWHTEDWHPGKPTGDDLASIRSLRDRLRGVFEAADEAAAAGILNELLDDAAARPRISVHSANPHLHFEPQQGGTSEWLTAATAMGLAVILCDFGIERFGSCCSSDCRDVFVDTSKNRSRRHCTTTCGTRENVAAHRRRMRDR